ncbi:MAG: hypothetical protein FJX54_06830 [Alphaproteobacteria bacterium]|nr:hypothetical protein [Alphaproteobacteria bacterium]
MTSLVVKGALAAGLGVALWSAAALAQASGPLRLVPVHPAPPAATEVKPAEELKEAKPAETEGAPSAPGAVVTSPSSPQSGIQVDTLQVVDADSVGVLTAADGALPTTLWRGTPRPLAERLIALLPALPESRVSRDLTRRLLLSPALLPDGPPAEPKLLALRAEKLAAMGEVSSVDRLLKAMPSRITDERLARLKLDSAYLLFDSNGACAEIRRVLGVSRTEAAQRGQAFCQALAGNGGQAELSLRLLTEQGFKPDPTYDMLMDALINGTRPRLAAIKDLRPMDLALLRAAKQPAPPDAATSRVPTVWWPLADSPSTEAGMRLALAERLEAAGLWSVAQRTKVILEADLPAELLDNPLSRAEADSSARGRAILRRALDRQQTPLARAQVIDKALALGAKNNVFAGEARLYAQAIQGIEPSVDLNWFAPAAARALIVVGRLDAARGWLQVIEAPRDDATRAAADRLWALGRLAGGDALEPWRADRLDGWVGRTKAQPEEAQRLARLLALMEAIGEPVDGRLWRDLVADGDRRPVAMPSPALLPSLADAAANDRLGEGIAFAALALGETRLADLPPPVLGPVVAGLARLGLLPEARALAVEAAVAAGL